MHRPLRNRFVIICLLVCLSPVTVFSQARTEPKRNNPVDPDFTYTSKDRRDPFEPVFVAKLKQHQASGKLKEGYEIEELKLVGVLRSGGSKFAMMEDMQGKGLLFKQGDFLNKITWIMDVEEERVTMAYKIKGDVRKVTIDIPRK
jgi:Tfp pilus assembly protein PilP